MFCPKCKAEYIEGIAKCPVCRVGLISELPIEPKQKPEYMKYEEILKTSNAADIAILKSILDSEHITYFFQDEEFNRMIPSVEPVRLMVNKDEAQKTREFLSDLKLNLTSVSREIPGKNQGNDTKPEMEEEPHNDIRATRPSGKVRYFMIGLTIGMLLAGSYAVYHIYQLRHFSGTDTYDHNKDGKIDSWMTYQNGILSSEKIDQNFDGKVDGWADYDHEKIIRSKNDTDFNGIPDITYYYIDGVVDSSEIQPNGSSTIIKKEYYQHGILKEEWVDTNDDGKLDQKNTYDFLGNQTSSSPL